MGVLQEITKTVYISGERVGKNTSIIILECNPYKQLFTLRTSAEPADYECK